MSCISLPICLTCETWPLWKQLIWGCGCGIGLLPLFGTTLLALLLTAGAFYIYSINRERRKKIWK